MLQTLNNIRTFNVGTRLISRNTIVRNFGLTNTLRIQIGDSIPNTEIFEDSPGSSINLSEEISKVFIYLFMINKHNACDLQRL